MFCPKCGKELREYERSCPYCGAAAAPGSEKRHRNKTAKSLSIAAVTLVLIVACIWYLVITSILMVIQSRLEKHFGKGFDARPAGARGKRTPLPGKTFGEPKDDIDKQNEATFAGMTA